MIELLVVILIIAALIAILVPTLGGSRTAARRAKCLANANGIAQAVNVYLDDNRRVYPGGQFGPSLVDVEQFNLLGKEGTDAAGGGTTLPENRILTKYISNTEAAHCPLDEGDVGGSGSTNFNSYGTSYIYYDRTMPQIAAGTYIGHDRAVAIEAHRATEITKPAKKLLTADAIIDFTNRAADQTHNQWHNKSDPLEVSTAFADGHAATAKRKTAASGNPANFAEIEDWSNDAEGYY